MEDWHKTKAQLVNELKEMRKRITGLVQSEEQYIEKERVLLEKQSKYRAERKRVEEALRKSEEKFSKVFMLSPSAVVLTRLSDGTMLDFNECFTRIMGYRRDEAIGKSSADLSNWADPEHRKKFAQVLKETGKIDEMETSFRAKDGRIVPVIISGRVIEIGGETCVVSASFDMTGHRKAEDELKFWNIILSTQKEVSIDGILVVDENGKMILYNNKFVDMWGLPEEVMKSQSDERALEFVLDKLVDPAQFLEKVRYLYEYRHEKSRDEIALTDNRTFDRYSAPMLGPDEKYYGRVWYFRDVTERRQAEEERERLILELKQALSKVKTLAGLLPICASCKRIRNDKGYWEQVEIYISHHSEAEFSHGFCPECAVKLYPELYEE